MANPSKERSILPAFPHLAVGGLGRVLAASTFLGTGSVGCLVGAELWPAGTSWGHSPLPSL